MDGEEEKEEEETGKRYELIQINIRINAIIKIPKLPSSFLLSFFKELKSPG